MKRLTIIIFSVTISVVMQLGHSFDGNLQGFMIEVGAGVHSTDFDYSGTFFLNPPPTNNRESGIATTFKIGGGVSDNLLVYYINDVSWITSGDFTITGLTGAGLSYFITPNTSSMYLTVGIGLASMISFNGDSDAEQYTGTGISFGIGYRLSNGLGLEINQFATNVDNDESPAGKADISSLRFILSYMWY